MNLSNIKKLFGKKKKNMAQSKQPENDRTYWLKNLEVFRHLPDDVTRHVDGIQSTLTEISDRRSPADYQRFVKKLHDFSDFLKQNVLLQEYVNNVYSKEQQSSYYVIVGELCQTFEELSSNINNMLVLNDRNLCAANMMTEIAKQSKQYEHRKKQVCADVESIIANHMESRWIALKTSADKQLLDNFLKEIVGQKNAIHLRQEHAVNFLALVRVHSMNKYRLQQTVVVAAANKEAKAEADDVHRDEDDSLDDSLGSSIIIESNRDDRIESDFGR